MSKEPKISYYCNLCNQQGRVIFVKSGFNIVKCLSCGLIYVGNPPSEAELEKLYSFDSGYHIEFGDDESECKKYLNLATHHYEVIKKYKT